jgi:predicted phage terminase large subunit-like protein
LRQRAKRAALEWNWKAYFEACWSLVEGGRPLRWNWHLDVIGEYLMAFRRREIRLLCIHVPPRSTKSLSVSVVYPTMVWTTEPWHQFLSVSNEEELAIRDAVKSRSIVQSLWYRTLWGHKVKIDKSQDSNYTTTLKGHRLAEGMHSNITGKGGDTILIDDPHDSDKVHSDAHRQRDLDAYDNKLSTRLNDRATGGIAIIMQRQHHDDLSAHVRKMKEQSWTTLVLPMEYDGPRYIPINARGADPRTKAGQLLDPLRVTRRDVAEIRETLGHAAEGQLQQNPTAKGGAILKRSHWRKWPENRALPTAVHVMQSYDTAYTDQDLRTASYSARTTWGIFLNEFDHKEPRHDIMLLEAWRDRIAYPDLRRKAKADFKEWRPGRVLVEKKASGISLVQDLRRGGLPVSRYIPDIDKVARAWTSSVLLDSGRVWYPDRKWAEPVIQECAEFPSGRHNDWVDTCTMAWLWLLRGWWVSHPDDQEEGSNARQRKKLVTAPYG